jgi:hypothetical protein
MRMFEYFSIGAHSVFATFCAFMLGATRTAAPSSAHRIAASAACHPSVASAHSVFATFNTAGLHAL